MGAPVVTNGIPNLPTVTPEGLRDPIVGWRRLLPAAGTPHPRRLAKPDVLDDVRLGSLLV